MSCTRSRLANAILVAAVLAACSDALITAPPRPNEALPTAQLAVSLGPIIVAAGDVGDCDTQGDEATGQLLDGLQFDAVLALGDLAYESGTAVEYETCYTPTWGRHRDRTRPTPGNHEYRTTGAAGYFGYFGLAAKPQGESYYSFNLGSWHILSLNSNISASHGSPQLTWIRQDLAANPTACSLAYWHHPVRSSGEHGNLSKMAEVWRVLDSAGVDVVLVGHDHDYERFAPQTATGGGIATGIRQFVVGTGGTDVRPFATIQANSEARNSDTWGVLKMALNAASYEWRFIPVAGGTFADEGTADCVQTTPPEPNLQPVAAFTAPSDGATFSAPATITLTATASDPDGNLNRVEFYRGSTMIGHDASPPYTVNWKDVPAGTYSVTVRAVDAAEAWTASGPLRVTVSSLPNAAPTVSLTAPSEGATFTAPASITLAATAADADGNLVRVEFLSGQAVIGSATAAPYSFTWTDVPAGTYTLTARALDAMNATGTSSVVSVTVAGSAPVNKSPVANPAGPYAGEEGVSLTLNGAGSNDPDGDVLTYAWQFGDGATSTAQSPSHTYGDNGTYTATLVVTDPSGASHSATTTVTIANVAPTGTFTAPASVASGAPYTLAIQNVSDVAADVAGRQYQFDCGDGPRAWSTAATTTCPGVAGPATRAVRGAVRDKDGGAREFAASVEVLASPPPPNSAPTVGLTGPADGAAFTAPATITLAATAEDVDGNLTRVEFLHDATVIGSANTAPYSFTWTNVAAGGYTLAARAIDAVGETTLSNAVRVTVLEPAPVNHPPTANPGGPYTANEGVVLKLNGGGSTDPDGGTLTYAWSFGDGTTAMGPAPSKTYGDNGTYTIALTVTDPSGASSTATTTATIANLAPKGIFVGRATVASGASYTLSIEKVTDVAPDVPGLDYRFDCGAGFAAWSTAASVSCAGVTGPARRLVRGAVRDKDAGDRYFKDTVQVLAPTNNAPAVALTAPADGATYTAPATVTLGALASDADGNLSRVEFLRDGTVIGSATSAPYSFTWTDAALGTYTLTARAIDAANATTLSNAVRVTVTAPPAPNRPPVANAGGPYGGSEGVAITLDARGSSDPDGDGLAYTWDFGDGTTAAGPSPSKTYGDNGTYTIALVVSDPSGASSRATTVATIVNVAPTGILAAPTTVASGQSYTLAIEGANDVAADRAGLEFRFDCGAGFEAWGAVSSASCAGMAGPAVRTVRGGVRDKDAGAREVSATVQVLAPPNRVPVADPGGAYQGAEGVALTFDGSGSADPDGDALTYAWDFGDGTTASGRSVAKTYADNGSYAVTLVVKDPAGAGHSATTTATIANVAPTGTFAAPASAESDEAYTLSITGASDVDADLRGLEYQFDCGAGFGAWGAASSVSCPGVTGPVTRGVRGAVRDQDGGSRQFTAGVDILAPPNRAPTVSLTGPSEGATFTAPASITLAATAADADGNLVRVEFLSGQAVIGSATAAPYSFTWTDVPAGTYTLTARALDAAGATAVSNAAQVRVNRLPTTNPGGPYSGNEGVAVTLDGRGSSDPDGDALTYAWSFGDGATSTAQSPSHTYGDNGTYTVTLVVTDPFGSSHGATTTMTVANLAPTGTFAAPESVSRDASYTLAIGNASDVAADRPGLQYRFDCGDGFGAWGASSSVTCPGVWSSGTRTVRGAVRDKDGGMREFTAEVEILRGRPS